jgi:asparagine synthetase B (glutamine-hydrolysing)
MDPATGLATVRLRQADLPKMGFGVPIDHWLRGPLRDWAEELLSEAALTRDGLFNPAPIRARWTAHLRGPENWQYSLWTIITMQACLTRYTAIPAFNHRPLSLSLLRSEKSPF